MNPLELRILIDGLAGLPYGGEAVDQRTHALQCAWHALAEDADAELVMAALLHDVGRSLYPELDHEQAGERFGYRLLGMRVGWLIGRHAQAKRYLVCMRPTYVDLLSQASIDSLELQGGPMTVGEAEAFASHPWAEDAVRLRCWDDLAKVPGAPEADLDEVLEIYSRLAAR